MKYSNIVSGSFVSRPNRFIAKVNIYGTEHTVHVKNTGRCKELLVPGCTVFLEKSDNPNRKTIYDLVAVVKGHRIINMDSQAPNAVFARWVKDKCPDAVVKRENNHTVNSGDNPRVGFYIPNLEVFQEILTKYVP
ncbi:MAG: DNA/RNA nuclease SfsA, partial [Oscillospiraceae bacterium]|nr:DNA/RNA nuclease SfsA [Oscillospiraceae bacterium]